MHPDLVSLGRQPPAWHNQKGNRLCFAHLRSSLNGTSARSGISYTPAQIRSIPEMENSRPRNKANKASHFEYRPREDRLARRQRHSFKFFLSFAVVTAFFFQSDSSVGFNPTGTQASVFLGPKPIHGRRRAGSSHQQIQVAVQRRENHLDMGLVVLPITLKKLKDDAAMFFHPRTPAISSKS